MLKIGKIFKNEKAINFCKEFINSDRPKYIFGRGSLAESVANFIDLTVL